jgi:hypothetical protein
MRTVKGILAFLVSAVIIPVLLAWLPERAPALTHGMLRLAASWLPPNQRWRYLREWVADVHMELRRGNKFSALFLAAKITLVAPATALAVRPLRPVLGYWARRTLSMYMRLQPWLILLLLVHQILPEELGWLPTFLDWLVGMVIVVIVVAGMRPGLPEQRQRPQLRLALLRGLVPAVPEQLHRPSLQQHQDQAMPRSLNRWLSPFRVLPTSHAVQLEVPQCA